MSSGFVEFLTNYSHLGVESGGAVTVTRELKNTRIQFGGYYTVRDTAKVYMRDPNRAGAAVDLGAGSLYI